MAYVWPAVSAAVSALGSYMTQRNQSNAAQAQQAHSDAQAWDFKRIEQAERQDDINRYYLEREDAMRMRNEDIARQAAENQENYARQKEFAQMGIRWKTEDAKAAGLHPLAALGGTGAGYSPTISTAPAFSGPSGGIARTSSPSMSRSGGSAAPSAMGSILSALGDASSSGARQALIEGQNTLRAEMATKTANEIEMEQLSLRNAQLRNSVLEMELAAKASSFLGQPKTNPLPESTGARSGAVVVKPSQVEATRSGDAGTAAGTEPAFQYMKLDDRSGGYVPSKAAAEQLEGIPGALAGITAWKNAQAVINGPGKPKAELPPGYVYQWNMLKGTYEVIRTPQAQNRVTSWKGAVSGRGNSR